MSGAFFIIDTNVLVAGLLTSHADSPVACILDGMLGAAFPFVLSEAQLAEYRAVLVRPRLAKLHGLSEAEIEVILVDIARHAIVLAPVRTVATPLAPDPGDQFLWDLLASRPDLVLVTGDKLLLQDEAMQPRVISPQTFAAQIQH
ncbi:MAG: PIN domain-containing protein [Rhodoferax sp.]|nr:PIN domain-containing protein [Rhodoferax sp.]MBP7491024.1 PIN domain-containing protein [Rhodoferax sp.]